MTVKLYKPATYVVLDVKEEGVYLLLKRTRDTFSSSAYSTHWDIVYSSFNAYGVPFVIDECAIQKYN
jgi:hypothetical protein